MRAASGTGGGSSGVSASGGAGPPERELSQRALIDDTEADAERERTYGQTAATAPVGATGDGDPVRLLLGPDEDLDEDVDVYGVRCQLAAAAGNGSMHCRVAGALQEGLDSLAYPGSIDGYDKLEGKNGAKKRETAAKRRRRNLPAAWVEDFKQRPSWCDAGLALKLVKARKADGNKFALRVRSAMQEFLYRWGCAIQRHAVVVIVACVIVLAFFASGLREVEIQVDIVKLWVEEGGRLSREQSYLGEAMWRFDQRPVSTKNNMNASDEHQGGITDGGLDGGFTLFIQTPKVEGHNVLNREDLLTHARLLKDISDIRVKRFGFDWGLEDLCFKPPAPEIDSPLLGSIVQPMIDRIIPCVVITPLDCFWDGGKHLGPSPPVYIPIEIGYLIPGIQTGNITWDMLNPAKIVSVVKDLFDIGVAGKQLERAGLKQGYMDRHCIDPLEEKCPMSAPNGVDICELVEKYPDYGAILGGGCKGFARDILYWPPELIVGGAKTKEGNKSHLTHAESYQSIMLLGNAGDIHKRFMKGTNDQKEGIEKHKDFNVSNIQDLLDDWQRSFTRLVYGHENNIDGVDEREFHPLAGTSISDMMKEFSEFKAGIIVGGYFFMFLYAGLSLVSFRRGGLYSGCSLGFSGVVVVTMASAAGLGVSIWPIGIDFNAATTQIIPFLTLGLGVDDMFLLVHNYMEVTQMVRQDEIGFLLKETGLSVMLTSISNILAFLSGGLMPIPAMRSFCLQTAIVLAFNMFVILTLYPAVMVLDLRRRRANMVDLLCCMTVPPSSTGHSRNSSYPEDENYRKLTEVNSNAKLHGAVNAVALENGTEIPKLEPTKGKVGVVAPTTEEIVSPSCCPPVNHWTLHHFVAHAYVPFLQRKLVKAAVIVLNIVLLSLGVIGLTNLKQGLELSDVTAKGTAPYDFLQARENYFSFYPMSIVLEEFDLPTEQHKVRQLRDQMLRVEYVVSTGGELGDEYWLSLFTGWLRTMDVTLDGMRNRNGSYNDTFGWFDDEWMDEERLAYNLACSVGDRHELERFETVRFVDDSGNVRKDSFYNALTAWYTMEQMMYYVSRAEFFPTPPKWKMPKKTDGFTFLVPPADPLMFSTIPFYLNDLVDTEPIVDMIKQVRAICDDYTERGVNSHPSGIPFTFWEQYILLSRNLLIALAVVIGAVLLVISSLLMSPWTGAVVVSTLIVVVLELGGFMGLIGVKMNPISAVSMITAVGIGVEFTVHVSLVYLTSLGKPNSRMRRTLEHMFIPVLHGGVSTMLGVVMLLFTQFEFIIRYFFLVLFGLVVIGLFNGLVYLPVLLSLVGPPCEVRPVDGGDELDPGEVPELAAGNQVPVPPQELDRVPAARTRGELGANEPSARYV